jgi:hypothetical protein
MGEAEVQTEAEKAAAFKRGVEERDAQARREVTALTLRLEAELSEVCVCA